MTEVAINAGDTAWVLASSALVLLMTPGLAFFYGGMVRAKSALNMMMMSMITIAVVSVLWVIYGFKLAFGYEANSPWYGSFELSGLGDAVNELTNNGGIYPIPLLVFATFQLMFAIITPALISGAIADRAKFVSWTIFVALWVTVVYFPVAHWVFAFGNKVGDTVTGAGFLASRGVEDFAGGTAVHINAGAAGLALAIVLGRRIGWQKSPMRPHSLPLVLLGGVHLVGGIVGSLAIGFFGSSKVNSLGLDGLFYGGGTTLLGKQALGVGLVMAYSFVMTLIIGFLIEKTIGFRVKSENELAGVDLSEHAESAYEMGGILKGGR